MQQTTVLGKYNFYMHWEAKLRVDLLHRNIHFAWWLETDWGLPILTVTGEEKPVG